MEDNDRYLLKCAMLIFFICISVVMSAFYYRKYSERNSSIVLDYTETSNIDYKVYLKKNNFFDNEFLTKSELETNNMSIITQLIDHINFTYSYAMSFSEPINGHYTYYLKGVGGASSVDVNNKSNYWSKEYILTEKATKDILNAKNYSFITNIDINYDKYNELLAKFKKEFNLSTEGKLDVYLVVENTIENEGFKDSSLVGSDVSVSIPLTINAMNMKIDTNNGNKSDTFKETFTSTEKVYNFYKLLTLCFMGIALILAILLVRLIVRQKNENKYFILLKKILSTYDGIIVNVATLPKSSGYNIVKVKSFDELLDAHSEVRQPINYYNSGNKHVFILVGDSMMWVYRLRTRKVDLD